MTTPDVYFPHLGIKIGNLNRVAFSIFGIDIYKYGLIIAIGVVLGILLAIHEAKRTSQDPDIYTDFVFWGIISGIVGARLYYIVFHGNSLTDFFAIRNGGLAIYGGIIGALIAVVIYTHAKKIPLLLFTDTAAMSLVVGQILGRWGNFFNKEAFGRATESLFAMAYKANEVAGLKICTDGTAIYDSGASYPLHSMDGVDYIWVHPTFLYESCWNLVLLGILFFVSRHKRFSGEISAVYFLVYGIGRFLIESLRTDQLLILGIPVSILVSALLAICAAAFLIHSNIKLKGKANV